MSKLVINKYSVDKKELSVIFTFLGWLIVGYIICFIGINNVFAATYYMNREYLQQYYDNRGSSVVVVNTTWNESFLSYISDNITTVANSYGAGLSISSPIPILENHTYTLSIYFPEINNVTLSSKNHIAISTGLSGAATNYANGNYYVDMVQSNVNSDTILQFVFTAKGHGSFIFIPWTTKYNTTQDYVLTQITMEDLGSEGVSINDINSSLSSQTNELNNSIQNSTNEIKGEIDDMEQSIIDSNKETQDVIKDQFNDCRESINLWKNLTWSEDTYAYFKLPKENTPYTLAIKRKNNNTISLDLYFGFTQYGSYNPPHITHWLYDGQILRGSTKDGFNYITNYSNGMYLNYISIFPISHVGNINDYFEIQLQEGTVFTSYENPNEEVCSNRLDETNDKLDDLNGTLNNSNSTGATNDASNFFSNFTTDTFGLTSIITAPLSLINNLTSSSCSTLRLPLPYLDNKYLELPCMNTIYSKYFGSFFDIYQTITFGIVAYWVIVRVFNQVKDFKNPDHDEIEVLDL